MNQEKTTIKRVLISVSDKTGIVDFARALASLNIDIISTGGTYNVLREADIPVRDAAQITGFPEMMDGRIKTLHPKIHGGILGLRDQHADIAKQYDIDWFDLVIVNLYPFAEVIKKPNVTLDEAIENIDIGGPAMIRSAAKNMGWVGIIIDPFDYSMVLEELIQHEGLTFHTRKTLAIKAFGHTAEYDRIIHHYLATQEVSHFLNAIDLHLEKWAELRYGENPHQKAAAYQITNHHNSSYLATHHSAGTHQTTSHLADANQTSTHPANTHQTTFDSTDTYQTTHRPMGILDAKQYQGKQLSFNNITDSDAALACIEEFDEPACVIVKHANPCGVAIANDVHTAFIQAFEADSLSAFGGIIALNRKCDKLTVDAMAAAFFEVIIAPCFTEEALALLAKKTNCRVLEMPIQKEIFATHEFRFIRGGVLFQDRDTSSFRVEQLNTVTQLQPSAEDLENLMFAYRVVKHVKSNAIVIAKHNVTSGIGAGQVSRVDAVDIALKKAGQKAQDAVLASDAFFPFRDSIDRLAGSGIRAIVQPGGSVRDAEVIAACDEHGIAMVFTGMRSFKH
jgi:phosphoribosylaminoimidazolecarboxamide formyltransferase / IMP cyclohydrolase